MAFVLVSGCIGDLKRPEASVTGVSLSGITATETGLDISVAIFNQNPVPVRIEHTDLRLSFWNGSSWAPLGTAYKGMFQVHPSGETRILVPVTLNNTALCDLLWHLIVNSDVKVRVNGTVFADLLLASYPVSFEDERVLKRGDTLLLLANAAFRSVTGVNILPQRPL